RSESSNESLVVLVQDQIMILPLRTEWLRIFKFFFSLNFDLDLLTRKNRRVRIHIRGSQNFGSGACGSGFAT
ncbi:MAG: hypothetical protein ACK559_20965, partial [bacterium]